MRLAVINTRMPGINTFLVRDLRALLQQGVGIDLYLFEPSSLDPQFRYEVEAAGGSITRIRFPWGGGMAAGLLDELRARPGRLVGSLAIGLWSLLRSPAEGVRALAVLPTAVVLGHAIARSGAVQAHALWAGVPATVAYWVGRHTAIPYSFSAHAWDLLQRKHLLRRKTAGARGVVVCSEFARRALALAVGEQRMSNVSVVHHGLDLTQWHFSIRPRPQPGANLLAIGRLTAKKGFQYLIQACQELQRRGLEFQCSIVGPDGGEGPGLSTLISDLGMSERVQLRGEIHPDAIRTLLWDAHLLVCPSVESDQASDGIPNVVLEALASGTPVVATNAGGIPEVIRSRETGWLAPQRDPSRLATVVMEALADWPASQRMAANGRALLEQAFDARRNATTYLESIGLAAHSPPRQG